MHRRERERRREGGDERGRYNYVHVGREQMKEEGKGEGKRKERRKNEPEAGLMRPSK